MFNEICFLQVTGTYDTNKCQRPCSLCLCSKDDLSNTRKKLEYRTEVEMKALYNTMMESNTATEQNEIAKTYSMHPVMVCRICCQALNIFIKVETAMHKFDQFVHMTGLILMVFLGTCAEFIVGV